MAQIIKHRRGSLESLSAVTSSLQKGEIVIASGSSNLTVNNGSSIVFVASEAGQVQAVNRFLMGTNAPNNFAAGTYNGLLKGVPYYASGSATLYLLGEGTNDIPNLVGNIQPFSTSVDSRLDSLEASVGGSDITTRVTTLEAFTGSQETKNATLATYTASVNSRLDQLSTDTGSQNTRITTLESKATTLETVTSSLLIETANLETFSASAILRLNSLETDTGSQNTRISVLETKATTLETVTSSLLIETANLETFSASALTRLTNIESATSSINSTNTAQNSRLTSLESVTGSYAKLSGGNTFIGTQIITGSLFVTANLVVQGSSSLENITASAVDIGTNIVKLNTSTPAVRFGGISVQDSGSAAGVSGSLFWDSLNNHWLYVQPSGANEGYNSAILIAGPQNTGSIGNEIGITAGYIPVAGGENHIENSIITQATDNTKVTIDGKLGVSGSFELSSSATNFLIEGNQFSQTYLTSNGAIVLNPGFGGVEMVGSYRTFQATDITAQGTLSASVITGIGNVTAFSTSVDSRLDSVEASLGGGGAVGTRVTALEAFTSSQETKNTTLQTYTASVDSRLNQLSTDTGSQNTRITTLESKATTLQTYTASVDSRLNQLSTDTGSQNTRITTLETKATTLASVTSSLLIETANLETFSASALLRLSSLETDTGSQNTRITTLESKATTLQTYTASVDSRLNQLSTASGSAIGRLNNLESFTSSTFPTFSTSVDTRLDTLEGTGTIQGVGQGNAVTFASINSVGNLTVGGDLVVEGNSVTLNTSILVVEDKTIQLASGSTNAATANGAGIEVLGANATFTYASSPNAWTANIPFSASAFTGSFNVPGGASTKRIAFRNTNDNISFVSAPTTSGDLVQWDGSDFVMSNVIDGGSF